MKRFILKLSLAVLTLIILDYGIGSLLKMFYFKASSGSIHRTTYVMEESTDELLIFGHSRASRHYNVKILENETGLSTYNAGRDGILIFYQLAVLKSMLKRHAPKKIILEFHGDFALMPNDYNRLSMLLPYYSSHPEIRPIVDLKSPFEKYKLWSKIYPYNSMLTSIAITNTDYNKKRAKIKNSYKGYVPTTGVFQGKLDSLNADNNYKIDENKYAAFDEFIELTKENKIQLVIVCSPIFYNYDYNYSVDIGKKISLEKEIPFLDYSQEAYFMDKNYLFEDPMHLNQKGATYFTSMLIEDLKELEFISKD